MQTSTTIQTTTTSTELMTSQETTIQNAIQTPTWLDIIRTAIIIILFSIVVAILRTNNARNGNDCFVVVVTQYEQL